SSRASRARRALALRRRRRSLRSRCSMLAAAAGLAVLSAGAVADGDKPKQPKLPKATIKAAQTALGVEADGIIGPKTRRAIRRFQRKQDLVVDGILGPQTLRALGVDIRRASAARADGSVRAVLERIAECESGGDPEAVSASGRYRGKYQFDRRTWRSVGGKGDPAKASEAEQDRRALKLYRRDGATPWPNCA
ncbi:MAG: transglycosylase family protein, partial [Solirubrobacteraceae bacterium]